MWLAAGTAVRFISKRGTADPGAGSKAATVTAMKREALPVKYRI